MLEIVLAFAILSVFAFVSAVFGTDSRDGNDWIIHRSP